MDTVYGTKKYFQSISGVSDIYRTRTCRPMNNECTFHNTPETRSQLGAYYHMNKQPSYTNDHSITSQYDYNSSRIWRDNRNIASSTFSAKTYTQYQKTRSFSIILTTAAFIVLIAIITIAGLALYLNSIKTTLEYPVIGFEGSFRIAKGDLYSTGLKYNHTTTYKQKVKFYKKFIESTLTDNGLHFLRVDVWGFGEGPLIKVSFRLFLDVRKLPLNIVSVEEFIKESLLLQSSLSKFPYRNLRLDNESVDIKRILDEQLVRSAVILNETNALSSSQSFLEKRTMKNNPPAFQTSTPKIKTISTPRLNTVNDEADVDVDNAPVIQSSFEGSFEITKTDADISRKKTVPTRAYHTSSFSVKSITPHALRVNTEKPSTEDGKTLKVPARLNSQVEIQSSTTTSINSNNHTTNKLLTTTLKPLRSTIPNTTVPALTTLVFKPSKETLISTSSPFQQPTSPVFVPKLDANLFTTFPILDTQPWRPIHREVSELLPGPPPAIPTKTLHHVKTQTNTSSTVNNFNHIPQRRFDNLELPFIVQNSTSAGLDSHPLHGTLFSSMRKPDINNDAPTQQDTQLYHSFSTAILLPGTENIETLGSAVVEPHPLPVPLIDDVIIPPFKPIKPTFNSNERILFDMNESNEMFEHLGGGVVAKKNENSTKKETQNTISVERIDFNGNSGSVIGSTTTIAPQKSDLKTTDNSVLADTIGELFMEFLNLPKEDSVTREQEPIESRIDVPLVKLSADQNIDQVISELKKPNNTLQTNLTLSSTNPTTTTTENSVTKSQRVRPNNERPPTMIDETSLFPSHSKWEFVNSSSTQIVGQGSNMRKVFNKTLQAWVSEDVDNSKNVTINNIKTNINNATNIQDISLIFDTLASKLGITPKVPTKFPPFSQTKLKQSQKDDNKGKMIPTTTEAILNKSSVKTIISQQDHEPFIKPMSSFVEDSSSEVLGAAIPVIGEAEVEVMDPVKYEEMLKISQFFDSTSTEPIMQRLVTLLPVRSNSGIRTYKTSTEDYEMKQGQRNNEKTNAYY